jgi:hypothetical protein
LVKKGRFHSLGSNLILKDKIVRIDLEKPLEYIAAMKQEEDKVYQMFEPTKKTEATAQFNKLWPQREVLLRD